MQNKCELNTSEVSIPSAPLFLDTQDAEDVLFGTDFKNKRFCKETEAGTSACDERSVVDDWMMNSLVDASTSVYQGVSFRRGSKTKPWRLICQPLTPARGAYFPTQEAAADALKHLVETHIQTGNERPRSLGDCLQDETGRYLRLNKSERDLRLLVEPTSSLYQGISLRKHHKTKPWRLVCQPLTPAGGTFFPTEKAAADALKHLVEAHIQTGHVLPRSLGACLQDETGRYLRLNRLEQDLYLFAEPKISLYQGVSFQKNTKANPWRLICQPLTPAGGTFFPTQKAAAEALKQLVEAHIQTGHVLPHSLGGCPQDETGRYLRLNRLERDVRLVVEPTMSLYQGVSFQKSHKTNPWRLVCQPLTPVGGAFFPTQKAAADALKHLVDEHLRTGNVLPRVLDDCPQDEAGRYLRLNTSKELPLCLDDYQQDEGFLRGAQLSEQGMDTVATLLPKPAPSVVTEFSFFSRDKAEFLCDPAKVFSDEMDASRDLFFDFCSG